ncbi:hypothetical protein L195_g023850 [Trifolium pratense]|uniref:Uncharacterized protein n=1 Tax=Trifolium pratense TaxID=57577 RepID=A0A2K3NC09_TRIPR|nr:hypothetical protein L195_g023850 [Trifolium pratense]
MDRRQNSKDAEVKEKNGYGGKSCLQCLFCCLWTLLKMEGCTLERNSIEVLWETLLCSNGWGDLHDDEFVAPTRPWLVILDFVSMFNISSLEMDKVNNSSKVQIDIAWQIAMRR